MSSGISEDSNMVSGDHLRWYKNNTEANLYVEILISEESNIQNNQNFICTAEFSYVDVIFVLNANVNVYFDLKSKE